MINPLDKFCIEKKVRSCFAKSEDMVKEMISKIEREIDGDYVSNCYLLEDYPKTDVLSKGEIPGVIEKHDRCDSSSITADRDPMQEPLCFQDNAILGFLNHMDTHEKAAICFDDHPTKLENVVEEINTTIDFEKEGILETNEVLQHHVEGSESDHSPPGLKMEINQFMVPIKCEYSSIVNLGIEIMNSDEHLAELITVTNEEDVSIWMEPVYNEESSCFSPGLKSEVANDSTSVWYDAISLPEAFQFSYSIHLDLYVDISTKGDNEVNECEYYQYK